MKTKLELLQEEIAKIQRIQAACDHEWGEVFEETTKEPIYETKWQGVDPYGEIVGYRDVPCWSRICKKCEKKETTKKIGDVVVKTERRPIF